MMKTLATLATLSIVACGAGIGARPRSRAASRGRRREIQVLKVQGNVYMLAGPGGNTTVQVGDDGVLVVDTQLAPVSDKLLAAIRVDLAQADPLHRQHARARRAHRRQRRARRRPADAAQRRADPGRPRRQRRGEDHDHRARERAQPPDRRPRRVPPDAWPTETFFGDDKEVFFNGEAVQIFHQPAAQTDGDSIVFFRRSDVIATGDLFTTTMLPVHRRGEGRQRQRRHRRAEPHHRPRHSRSQGAGRRHDGRSRARPAVRRAGRDRVPRHGHHRSRSRAVHDSKGKTLDQIKAAKPTLDFDPRYGATSGSWTTTMFVEQIYRDLTKKK